VINLLDLHVVLGAGACRPVYKTVCYSFTSFVLRLGFLLHGNNELLVCLRSKCIEHLIQEKGQQKLHSKGCQNFVLLAKYC
jgi:hypothetical protein